MFNSLIFIVSFVTSQNFLDRALFQEQDLSHAKLNRYVFSFTFGCCILMLLLFLQEVKGIFDTEISKMLWRAIFMVIECILLGVIPLCMLREFLCRARINNVGQKKLLKNFVVAGCLCLFIFLIFLVDLFIFNSYVHPDLVSANSGNLAYLWAALGSV